MTAKQVILHVGAPKTGTSYLEVIMWSQQDRLAEDGIWMPGRRREDHDALMGDVRGGVWRNPDNPWTWARFARAARERDDVVLVSKEMLSGATPDQVEPALEALEGLDLHVVVGCRALSSSLPSAWQQLVKAHADIRYADWLANVRANPDHGFFRHHDPISIIRRWAPGLPADRVHVITMPRSAEDPTLLWKRFASAIGVDPDRYDTPERPANESIGAVEAEFLRRINAELGDRLPLRKPYYQGVQRPLIGPVLTTVADKRRFGVPERHAEWLEERSAQMIAELAACPCTVVGDLDDLRPRIDPTAGGPDDVTDEEIAQVAVRATTALLVGRMEERTAGPAAATPPPATPPTSPSATAVGRRLLGAVRSRLRG